MIYIRSDRDGIYYTLIFFFLKNIQQFFDFVHLSTLLFYKMSYIIIFFIDQKYNSTARAISYHVLITISNYYTAHYSFNSTFLCFLLHRLILKIVGFYSCFDLFRGLSWEIPSSWGLFVLGRKGNIQLGYVWRVSRWPVSQMGGSFFKESMS